MNARGTSAGFTLVELITVMTVSAILAVVVWRSISGPLLGFVDLSRRAELVDHGETALSRMARELKLALPNSVRISADRRTLEFLRTVWGGRYRAEVDPSDPTSDALDLSLTQDSFQILDVPSTVSGIASGGNLADCLAGRVDCVALYNTGQPADCATQPAQRTNAYCGDNLAGVAAFNSTVGTLAFDRSDGATPLPFRSPAQRVYIVDSPVSFACAGQALRRYADYHITPVQGTPPLANSAQLAAHVESCTFTYDPGNSSRAGLVTITLVLADTNLDGGREAVSLAQQIPLPNTP